MIDYAQHLIKSDRMLKVIHDACLSRNYEGAKDVSLELLAEIKLLINTFNHMSEEQSLIEAERWHRGRVQS